MPLMIITVVLLMILVQIIQVIGHLGAKHIQIKRGKGLSS